MRDEFMESMLGFREDFFLNVGGSFRRSFGLVVG